MFYSQVAKLFDRPLYVLKTDASRYLVRTHCVVLSRSVAVGSQKKTNVLDLSNRLIFLDSNCINYIRDTDKQHLEALLRNFLISADSVEFHYYKFTTSITVACFVDKYTSCVCATA